MPIHDWTCVDANLFHDFHQTWTANLCTALNGGLLPKGYFALLEQHDSGAMADSLAVPCQILAARGNRISIRRSLRRVVCVIEIVSPGNKATRSALRSFVEKAFDFLKQGVHLVVIDLIPSSLHVPQSIHKVIWDEVADEPFDLPADKPLMLASYVADIQTTAYIDPVGFGEILQDMPAFLSPDTYISLPLEATYQATWASCPEDMREAVERGEMPPDEAEEE